MADTMTLEQVRDSLREVGLNAGNDYKRAWAYELADAIDAAIKQREQDKEDAARYRWLRSTTNSVSNSRGERINVKGTPAAWDAAIDVAIAKESGR